ncbi:MAG: hypothetical protein O3C20_08985 [Verrucomicrobia bacterium]|nr:hypothetical protein [Verrucomicrobiota bacterium]
MLTRFGITIAMAVTVLSCGCQAVQRFNARGQLHGETVHTTLDSPQAAYYLSHYLQGEKSNPEFNARIDTLFRTMPSTGWPDREYLLRIAEEESVDFAALYLADLVSRDPASLDCQRRFQFYLENPDSERLEKYYNRYRVLFVPGWDYVKSGHLTGADLARPRQLLSDLGIDNRLIEIDPNGSVEENADLIVETLRRLASQDKKCIIAGASSAGPAIHLALEEFRNTGNVHFGAWINLGGILQGSPLFEHYNTFPRAWFMNAVLFIKGWKKDAVASMGAESCRKRIEQLQLPAGLLIVNYVGLSFSGQLSKYAKNNYKALVSQGPNDGLTLLADTLIPGSRTLIAPNSDHFFAEDPHIDAKTLAMAKTVISILEDELL